MRHGPEWAPDEVDFEAPSVARMYDYYLGGSHNFAVDRSLAEESIKAWPDLPHLARANRFFLHRAVKFLGEAGIEQFLDLGSGIPVGGNVHEIARAYTRESRTVYVDVDPVAVAHGKALLKDAPDAHIMQADLRDPESILAHPAVTGYLDFSRPVGVLMVSVLPWVPDSDDPVGIVAAYREACAPGSFLAMSHGTGDYRPETTGGVQRIYKQTTTPGTFRSKAHIAEILAGYELVSPGLVDVIHWRPDPDTPDPLDGDVTRYSMYAAVGALS